MNKYRNSLNKEEANLRFSLFSNLIKFKNVRVASLESFSQSMYVDKGNT